MSREGMAAGKPARPRADATKRRVCARSPGRRPRAPTRSATRDVGADVAVARGDRPVGTGPRDPVQLPRQPARRRLRPEPTRRGYAVGESGVLLRYGKTWAQEPALPPRSPGASFTSIAFAGSEAIVAYRKLLEPLAELQLRRRAARQRRLGLARRSDGRRGDRIRSAARASPGCPTAARRSQRSRRLRGRRADLRARRRGAPGRRRRRPSRAALRPARWRCSAKAARCARSPSGTRRRDSTSKASPPPPPGFPPTADRTVPRRLERRKRRAAPDRGRLERRGARTEQRHRTARAIQQLRHRLPARPGRGRARRSDRRAGLGGRRLRGQRQHGRRARHRGRRALPRRRRHAPGRRRLARYRSNGGTATFAIGGGAQCAAPCADRAEAQIGPDVWLSAALCAREPDRACARSSTPARVSRAGKRSGRRRSRCRTRASSSRYAALLGASASLPTFAAPSPTDLDGQHAEGSAFAGRLRGLSDSVRPEPEESRRRDPRRSMRRGSGLRVGLLRVRLQRPGRQDRRV